MHQTEEFISKFKTYCQLQFPPNTGTATSYSNAIKYLLEFMDISEITSDLISEIKSIEPDIRDTDSVLYEESSAYFAAAGRQSYLKKGVIKAALPVLADFIKTVYPVNNQDLILIKEVKDNQIKADFSTARLKHVFPIFTHTTHNYGVRRISGTAEESTQKVKSGRKAEKYFISFLTHLGFEQNVDFFDVANNKIFGYDVRLGEIGLEVKNIKSGGFFLSDNEIGRLENTSTNLIFIDIDNGIWLLKNSSLWLKKRIKEIKELRDFCETKFKNLDPCDIKIIFDNSIEEDIIDISNIDKDELTNLLLN